MQLWTITVIRDIAYIHSVVLKLYYRRYQEGNGLFNDALNTLYLRLYGVGHRLKDHSDNERGNPETLSDLQQWLFYMHHPTDRIALTTAFVTPVVEHWLEREIATIRINYMTLIVIHWCMSS